ncbi:MAG: hypothetical protein JSS11_06885 [Verrucomicrobia bacterium]|nr:hypothetical protein [Verrucomicrobiota bacterium]
MNNPRQQPVRNPERFISSLFDLAYGARDGSERLSSAEIKAQLKETGIDPDVAWKEFSALLHPQAKCESLSTWRKERLASSSPTQANNFSGNASRNAIVEEIERLLGLAPQGGAVFGRKWEESTTEDLAAVCNQLRRQIERSKSDEQQR